MHWLLKVMMNEVNTGYSYRSGLIRSDLVVGAGEGGKKKRDMMKSYSYQA